MRIKIIWGSVKSVLCSRNAFGFWMRIAAAFLGIAIICATLMEFNLVSSVLLVPAILLVVMSAIAVILTLLIEGRMTNRIWYTAAVLITTALLVFIWLQTQFFRP